jgi:hypothetical protein
VQESVVTGGMPLDVVVADPIASDIQRRRQKEVQRHQSAQKMVLDQRPMASGDSQNSKESQLHRTMILLL